MPDVESDALIAARDSGGLEVSTLLLRVCSPGSS